MISEGDQFSFWSILNMKSYFIGVICESFKNLSFKNVGF